MFLKDQKALIFALIRISNWKYFLAYSVVAVAFFREKSFHVHFDFSYEIEKS